jgi:RNA polymerase primary sigma factor
MAGSARRYFNAVTLWDWQREALDAWHSAGCRGIVEAVTGAGKTRLALAAIAQVLGIRGRVLVLVPTGELMRQWATELQHAFPKARIRSWGSGRKPSSDADVIVAIVNSVARSEQRGGWVQSWAGFRPSLLVADECHRYAASSFSEALGAWADLRLGLSATLERPDGGHERYLLPYFGSVVYELQYARALADEVVVPWDIVHVAVELTSLEAAKYRRHDSDRRNAAAKLEALWRTSREEPGFFSRVARAAYERPRTEATRAAIEYMAAFSHQRKVTGTAVEKFDAFGKLLTSLDLEARALVFTSTKEAAEKAASKAETARRTARVVHSDIASEERHEALADFREGDVHTLLAPRVLDEGVDVPDCGLAIIMGMGSSPRDSP